VFFSFVESFLCKSEDVRFIMINHEIFLFKISKCLITVETNKTLMHHLARKLL